MRRAKKNPPDPCEVHFFRILLECTAIPWALFLTPLPYPPAPLVTSITVTYPSPTASNTPHTDSQCVWVEAEPLNPAALCLGSKADVFSPEKPYFGKEKNKQQLETCSKMQGKCFILAGIGREPYPAPRVRRPCQEQQEEPQALHRHHLGSSADGHGHLGNLTAWQHLLFISPDERGARDKDEPCDCSQAFGMRPLSLLS